MKLQNIANVERKIYLFGRDLDNQLTIITDDMFFPFFYEVDSNGKFKSYDGLSLRKVFTSVPSDVPKIRSSNSYSSDILFVKNYLIHKIDRLDLCPIKYLFLDIEVVAKELPNPTDAKYPISSITIYNSVTESFKTWYLGDYESEAKLLMDFTKYIFMEKPDLILGWNMYNFDYPYLFNRWNNVKIPKVVKRNFAQTISPINQARYGQDDIYYPAGISIMDYLNMFKKVFMREPSYALDNVAQKHLKEASWGKDDFSVLSPIMRDKNINDVNRMLKLEVKYRIIDYFDEIRRLTKSLWEDVYHNSYMIEMLLFEEAKKKNVILPNKPKNSEESTFVGAIRNYTQTGNLYNIGKFDLTSAYPSMVINFCLDTQNIVSKIYESGIDTDPTLPHPPISKGFYKYEIIKIDELHFTQNPDTLLPSLIKKLLILKDTMKNTVKSFPTSSEEHKKAQVKYDAIKAVVNSAFGVMGYPGFRIYDNRIASTIAFLVRELLMFVKEKIEEEGLKVIYYDTDSVFIDTPNNIKDKLNLIVQQWAKEKYNKNSINLEFEYEGYFEKLFILTKCRYYGLLRSDKGLVEEIKGIEVKRSSSSKYEAWFQKELLNKVLNRDTKEIVEYWIANEKERIKTLPLQEIAFPAKVANRNYVNKPIFIRAVENTKQLITTFNPTKGELFYYFYVTSTNQVLAITADMVDSMFKNKVDWNEMIRRNIDTKTENIFEALGWVYNPNLNQTTLF